MKKNNSPWLHNLITDRKIKTLDSDLEKEVAIVGAGIAGVSTAFFTLKYTNKNVVLLERYKVAHGATGHNAGQVVSYFERGFASLVEEFGSELAGKGQKDIEDAWILLDEMYTDAKMDIPFARFLGHAGLSSHEQVMIHLNNNLERKKAGLPTEQFLIAEEISFISDIPQKFDGIYKRAPQKDILDLLETKNATYIACVSYQKGCLNSAFFCEKVLAYLSETYPDRFSIFEHTQIKKIILKNDHCLLDADKHVVKAQKTILCTNGFDHVVIFTDSGLDVDTKFHHMVEGTVGYMSGYIESVNKPPIAISYLTDPDPSTDDPYYYLTRREYDFLGNKNQNLISIGGPEISLEDRSVYSKDAEYPDEIIEQIDSFVKANYDKDPSKKIEYIFTWHGLMGYTKNGVRLIGAEPKHPNLLYNLGCNGVGILPSIFGGKKISDIIDGKIQEKSIFDIPTNK